MLSIESCYALIVKHETVETGPVCDMWVAQHIASITSSMDTMNSVISVDNSPQCGVHMNLSSRCCLVFT